MYALARSWLAPAALIILGLGFGVNVLAFWNRQAPEEPWETLVTRLPIEIDGWKGQDLPLGDTEALLASVKKLNYDDYIYRVYRKDRIEVYVYAMVWRQGRISVREMAGHTPDGCWPASGARHCSPPIQRSFSCSLRSTLPAEVRGFVFPSGQTVNVAWWHFWGNDSVDPVFSRKEWMNVVRESWIWLVQRGGARRDQIFIRIHATERLDTVMATEPVARFLSSFPQIWNQSGEPTVAK